MHGMADYDAIVIGSGSGGLTAALALTRQGKRVAVFERHEQLGGYTQSFEIGGFGFSPGVHYVGGLGPDGSLRRIYEGLAIANDLTFFELNPAGYDHAIVGTERLSFHRGKASLALRLKDRFPAERAGIIGYLDVLERMADEIAQAIPTDGVWDAALLPARMPTVLRYGLSSLASLLDRFTTDPLLRAFLCAQTGDHGMAPSRVPAALQASLVGYYMDGAWYPRGGAHSIADTMVAHIRAGGSEVHASTEVAGIVVEHGRVVGVRLADGRTVRAGAVVSDTDPGVTWSRLVPAEHVGRRMRRRVAGLRYSPSTLSLFLGVDMDLRAAGLDSGNYWLNRTTDVEAPYAFAARTDLRAVDAIPGLFLNATTLKDPLRRHDGKHAIEAVCLASYDAFAPWEHTLPGARPIDYRRLKQHLADRMLDAVETIVPGVRDRIVVQALATPLTNRRILGATRGNIYGVEKTLRNLGPFAFPIRSHLPGLFQCGASTLAPGILGVTTSGLLAAAAVLDVPHAALLDAQSGHTIRTCSAEDPATWPRETRPAA